MRVALYARYSSDQQNERSAEDQLAALRVVVAARGWQEVAAFADRGISGAALTNRPGVQTLLREAERGQFDVVLTEALDRLSRDQEGTAHLYKRLSFQGVILETMSEGRISELHVGLSGTMNQLFLVELAKKTRRGLVARVKAGYSGGGRCYGYDLAGKGELVVNEEQAEVVRRIFRDYAKGTSPKALAHALNAQGVPGPRGGTWSPSAIYGDRRAQDGILCQELYRGVRVFNRRRFRKHPETGRRSSVLNPQSEWIREEIPQLRIVSDDLWAAVEARQAAVSAMPKAHARKPKRLLSGLLRCAACGSAMTLNGGKYTCSSNRERGVCSNGKIIAAATVERRVVDGIRTKLLAPEAMAKAVETQRKAAQAERKAIISQRLPLERELAEIERKLARAKDMFLNGLMEMGELEPLVADLRARKKIVETKLAAVDEPAEISMHPSAAQAYALLAGRLHAALNWEDGEEVRTELRTLIERVDFHPVAGLGKFDLEVHGKLKALLGVSERASASHDCGILVGAGTGFEPVTFRL
jgi:site-specific DNA recombinase